jgi:hypothetical protein
MFVLASALLVLFWLGVILSHVVLPLEMALMIPSMILVMLYRVDDCSGPRLATAVTVPQRGGRGPARASTGPKLVLRSQSSLGSQKTAHSLTLSDTKAAAAAVRPFDSLGVSTLAARSDGQAKHRHTSVRFCDDQRLRGRRPSAPVATRPSAAVVGKLAGWARRSCCSQRAASAAAAISPNSSAASGGS